MPKKPANKQPKKGRITPDTQRLWETKKVPPGAVKDNPRGTK